MKSNYIFNKLIDDTQLNHFDVAFLVYLLLQPNQSIDFKQLRIATELRTSRETVWKVIKKLQVLGYIQATEIEGYTKPKLIKLSPKLQEAQNA